LEFGLMLRKMVMIALVAFGFVISTSTARAQAVVTKGPLGLGCFIPGVDADGNRQGSLGSLTQDVMIVQNGKIAILKCTGTVQNLSGKTQNFNDLRCMIPNPDPEKPGSVLTTEGHLTITKQGKASLTCRVKAKDLEDIDDDF
jgi:hypothetical protein